MRPMTRSLRKVGGVAILEVDGKLKMGESVDQFRTRWSEALNGGAKVLIIILSSVPVIDSSGLGSLMRCYSSLKAVGGRVKLVGANEVVRQALGVTHLEKLFDFYDDEAAALASIPKATAP
jgi:anti-sigma B factor antagonist